MMFLPPFWALNVVVVLLYMEGQEAFEFHWKYLNLCAEEWVYYLIKVFEEVLPRLHLFD